MKNLLSCSDVHEELFVIIEGEFSFLLCCVCVCVCVCVVCAQACVCKRKREREIVALTRVLTRCSRGKVAKSLENVKILVDPDWRKTLNHFTCP